MAKCRIWWDASITAYRAQFPFKQTVVDFLKQNIPHSERSWDSNTKIWTFTEAYLDGTEKFLRMAFGNQEVATVTRAQYEATQRPPSGSMSVRNLDSNDALAAKFMRSISYEAAKAAYRKACLELHPDHGGDLTKMSELNAIWSQVEKGIYGQ
jgi:hypothetical protein